MAAKEKDLQKIGWFLAFLLEVWAECPMGIKTVPRILWKLNILHSVSPRFWMLQHSGGRKCACGCWECLDNSSGSTLWPKHMKALWSVLVKSAQPLWTVVSPGSSTFLPLQQAAFSTVSRRVIFSPKRGEVHKKAEAGKEKQWGKQSQTFYSDLEVLLSTLSELFHLPCKWLGHGPRTSWDKLFLKSDTLKHHVWT